MTRRDMLIKAATKQAILDLQQKLANEYGVDTGHFIRLLAREVAERLAKEPPPIELPEGFYGN